MLNYQLTRRLQELHTELARHVGQGSEVGPLGVRRDSHNSGLPASVDLPGTKATSAIRRTRSLRRTSGKRAGGRAGHKGATLRQVEI